MALALKHATLTQLGAAFRERFRDARGIEAGRLARWLLDRITDGTFTDTQVRNFFGLTTPQYNAMKTRMTTMADRYDATLLQVGE